MNPASAHHRRKVMRTIFTILLLIFAGGFASAQMIDVNYYGYADYASYRTWAWQEGTAARDPEGERVIRSTVEQRLAKRGWQRVEEGADIYVRSDVLQTYSQMVGALRIDVIDVRSGELAWRGLASGVRTSDRKKDRKLLEKVLKDLLKQFPKAGG